MMAEVLKPGQHVKVGSRGKRVHIMGYWDGVSWLNPKWTACESYGPKDSLRPFSGGGPICKECSANVEEWSKDNRYLEALAKGVGV